jgi:dolichol kinase
VNMYPYLVPLLVVALIAYCAIVFKRKSDLILLAAFLAAGFLLSSYEAADVGAMLIGIALFSSIAATLGSRENYAMLAVAVAYVAVFVGVPSLIAQAALLGFLSQARSFMGKNSARNEGMERRRDLVQILIGAGIVAVFAVADYASAELFLLAAMLLGLMLSNYAISNPKRGVSRLLLSLERKNAVFGQGAMWLALGALIAISFLSKNESMALLASIFIGDAVATIVGIRYGRTALPYNKKKSFAGSAAYFASALLVSFPFLGWIAVLTAFAGAAVESLPRQIDDNFDTAVVLSMLMLLLSYMGFI